MLTKNLPAAVKNLVKRTGLRPSKVSIRLSAGPAEVHAGWSVDGLVTIDAVLQNREVTHWTGSDGESNTSVKETWSGPVAVGTKGHGKRKSTVVVYIPNLGELLPETEVGENTDLLARLWDISNATKQAPVMKVEEVTFVEPGPFTREDITTTTETDRKVILNREPAQRLIACIEENRKTAQVELMESLGLA